jgi:hypothetical protein
VVEEMILCKSFKPNVTGWYLMKTDSGIRLTERYTQCGIMFVEELADNVNAVLESNTCYAMQLHGTDDPYVFDDCFLIWNVNEKRVVTF